MKNLLLSIATAVLLLSFGCKHDQHLSTGMSVPDFQTLEQYEAYYDSLYSGLSTSAGPDSLKWPVTTVYLQNYPTTANQVEEALGIVLASDPLRRDSLTERDIVAPSDTIVLTDTAFLQQNTVLGITDVIFVWQGDTCTTALLENYLRVYEGGELQCGATEGKSRVVFLMVTGMLCGNPTEGVLCANYYLSCVLPCTDLSGYIAYAKSHQ